MTALGAYIVFILCLAVGLGGLTLFLKLVLDQFLTDRSLSDYRVARAVWLPVWWRDRYEQESVLAVLMRACVGIPPPRRVPEGSFVRRG